MRKNYLSNAIFLILFVSFFSTIAFSQEGVVRQMIKQRLLKRMQEKQTPVPEGSILVNLEHDGKQRYYLLHVPDNYDRSNPVPLVLVIHGGGGNPAQIEKQSNFDTLADRDNVIVAYPAGSSPNFKDKLLTWNTLLCDTYADQEKFNDIGFLKNVIDDIMSKYKIDAKRIYATGMSQGAMMSFRLGCEAADKIAAIGPVAGSLVDANCHPSAHVSAIIINGLADKLVRYDGAPGEKHVVVPHDSVESAVHFWTSVDSLPNKPSQEVAAVESTMKAYGPGPDGAEVVLWTHPGGHQWPGHARKTNNEGSPVNDLDATTLIWQFFQKHSK